MRAYFVVLSSVIIYLSPHVVQGRVVFAHDSSAVLAGSNATFICQDSERTSVLKNGWSFENAFSQFILSKNGALAPGVNGNKYKLLKSGTKLEIHNLTVNESGNYKCKIRGQNGETLSSATTALKVEATVRDEQATNTTHLLMSSTQHVMYAVTHNLQPTPATRYVMSAVMKSTAYRETASVSTGDSIVKTASDETAPCGNSTGHTDIAFIKEKTSPNLITVYQGENLGLRCSYCVAPSKDTTLSWYKEGLMISNDTHHVIHKDELGIPVVEHSKDEGLYQCVVSSNSGKISRFITVIVKKAESNPLLSTVLAQNKSYLSVQITWRLTDHGVFTSALVSLALRLLDSNDWFHVVSNISQDHGIHKFEHLQPNSTYLLNITLHNKYKQTESRALVFWSAATNSSEADKRTLILYHVTNRRALGVALGIIGLLVLMMIMYVCVTWCHNDKKGYSVPPGQQKQSEIDENDALFSVTSSMHYNRAFEDDKVDWMAEEEILS